MDFYNNLKYHTAEGVLFVSVCVCASKRNVEISGRLKGKKGNMEKE